MQERCAVVCDFDGTIALENLGNRISSSRRAPCGVGRSWFVPQGSHWCAADGVPCTEFSSFQEITTGLFGHGTP